MKYRWYILALVALTASLAIAMPTMCMPVLFAEISADLDLSLGQLGVIWGAIPLAGMSIFLICGLLSDRFGAKRILAIACFLAGLASILRGFSNSFATLTATMFLFGLMTTIMSPAVTKTNSTWFSGKHLGLANGVLATSMGLGFMLGSMISSTVLSPLLGGWRNVLFLYGTITIAISILWAFTRSSPEDADSAAGYVNTASFRQSLSRVIRIKRVWLLGLILLGQVGCIQGILGYLPIYLREIGWTGASADGTVAAFNGVSMLATVPIALLSDRIGSRKVIVLVATLMTVIGVSMLSVVDDGAAVWAAVIIAGVVRDGFMATMMTMTIETEGVGITYTGTAVGLINTLSRFGEFVAPTIGNNLAAINLSLPFIFWAALSAFAFFISLFVKENKRGKLRPEERVEADILMS